MDDKNLLTDEKLDELLAELAEEEDEDFSPDFYEHEMERILQRKKELEIGGAAKGDVISLSDLIKDRMNRLQPQWKVVLSIAAVFVFLICGTLLTRGSLRTNPEVPGGQIVIIDNPGGESSWNGPEVIDTSEVKNSDSFTIFMQDMWLFIKAALPYLCGAAAIALTIIIVIRKKRSANK